MTNQEIVFESDIVWWMTRVISILVFAAGLLMPEFYDWSGADQSRPAHIVGWIALGILIADAFMFVALAWLHFTRKTLSDPKPQRWRWRFSLFHILVATTIVAVFLMLARVTSMQIASWTVQAVVFGVVIWVAVQFPRTRPWILWTAMIQFAPMLWVFRHATILGLGAGVISIFTGLPNLVPVAFLVRVNHENLQWVSTLTTTGEFAICVWLSYLGSKRALAGGIVVATLSLFSSFVFHALVRM